ncbi:calcium-binding protein P-like [Ptychodera flava]|uniref:calcium-binding protein P-like n=1 Tax=Ptychodera flava TaxID=63121 RepID=UPI00396A744F
MDEYAAYRRRGIFLIIVGIILGGTGIFLIIFLTDWFYYGAMCIIGGLSAILIGSSLLCKAKDRVSTVQPRQPLDRATGPTVVTTTGSFDPPPAYGQYPSSNPSDFPPGLAPGGAQPQSHYSPAPPPEQAPAYGAGPYQPPPYSAAPPPGTYGKDLKLPGQA